MSIIMVMTVVIFRDDAHKILYSALVTVDFHLQKRHSCSNFSLLLRRLP